ncbi:MAG: 3-phosphoshikimate 1-carboxyvinyltransferase [Campylobacterales bacterium]|nr:3-phosphoshikimate 1-carboxyvinyltransferase [Campylobacterales bacterium]
MKSVLVEKVKDSFEFICDEIASDKSISHRCAIFSLLSDRPSKIDRYLLGEDTLNSLNIATQLGADVKRVGDSITITPPLSVKEPNDILDCGNAGTAIRLYSGFLSGLDGMFILTGDAYLKARPMSRVVDPLREIGAKIDGRENGRLAPLYIRGSKLQSFRYHSPIDSAQVKSALILAALRANATCYYKEDLLSRDHTERMLVGMGANIENDEDGWIAIKPLKKSLKPLELTVPADPSSAFFFALATVITPNSKIVIKNVSLNKTRIGAYKVLKKMGANIEYELKEDKYEPIGDIYVAYNGKLKAVEVSSKIAWLIDELPALAIAMAFAEGTSVVKNAKELRVKESDRITSMITNLQKCGIVCKEFEDGYSITGGNLQEAVIDSYGDHRVAMSFAIGGIFSGMRIEDVDCIDTSFPNFFDILSKITKVEF